MVEGSNQIENLDVQNKTETKEAQSPVIETKDFSPTFESKMDDYSKSKEVKKEKNIEKQDFDFEGFVNQIQKLDQSKSPDKKEQIAKLIDENRDNIIKTQSTTEFGSYMKKIRANPLTRENAYALQVYGNVCMDQNIKIDGVFGTQTETVLRVAQSEGIGGKKVDVYIAEDKKVFFQQYSQGYSLTVKGSIYVKSNNESNQKSNKADLSKGNIDGSSLIENNISIGEFILKNTSSDMKLEDFKLDNKTLEKFLTPEELEEVNSLEEYTPEIQARITDIKKQILNDSNQEIKKEALAGCINIFKKYMDNPTLNGENFINNFDNIDIKDDLKLEDNMLEIRGNIKGNPVVYKYSLSTGEIFASESLHKNNIKGFDVNNDYDLSESPLPIKLPTLDKLIKDGQNLVNSKDNPIYNTDILENYKINLSDKLSVLNEEKNPKDTTSDVYIEHNMEKNYAMNEFFDVIGPKYKTKLNSTDTNNQVYKLLDIVRYSLNYYTPAEIRKFRECNSNLKKILDKYNDPNHSETNEEEFGNIAFNQEKLKHDKNNINNINNQNSFYTFFSQMINKSDITDPKYNVINLDFNSNKQQGVTSFEEILTSFSKSDGGGPILSINYKLKETMHDISVNYDIKRIEESNFS